MKKQAVFNGIPTMAEEVQVAEGEPMTREIYVSLANGDRLRMVVSIFRISKLDLRGPDGQPIYQLNVSPLAWVVEESEDNYIDFARDHPVPGVGTPPESDG